MNVADLSSSLRTVDSASPRPVGADGSTRRPLYRSLRARHLVAASPRRAVVALVVVVTLVAGLAILRASQRHQVVRAGYALARVSERLRAGQEQQRRLQLELATLAAPERIRALASRMGMVSPSPERIRVVTPTVAVASAGGRP